ncbi:MAG: polysaccharide deacetylase family protein [Scrofimicrobium sp.]
MKEFPRKSRSLLIGSTVGLIAALALGGCSSNSGSAILGGGSVLNPTPEPPKITLGDPHIYPTDIQVEGLTGQRILSSTGSEARWSYLPGDQAFNPVLASLVGDYLSSQAQTREMSYIPEAQEPSEALLDRGCVSGSTSLSAQEILENPDLSLYSDGQIQQTITCEPVLASGTTFGERLRIVRGNPTEVVSDWVEVLYTDTATGETARGRDVIQEAALPVLLDALYENLKLDQPMSGGQVVPPSSETLADLKVSLYNVGFNDRGDAVVTVDGAFTSVIAAGDQKYQPKAETLVLPAERATELLTPLGAAISAAKASSLPWSGPGAVASGNEYVDCDLIPCVAVTYDDGPSAESTPVVLDAYSSRPYAAATFFLLGTNVLGNEQVLQRAVAEGHELANHSWNHPAFTTLDDASIQAEWGDTTKAIEDATGQTVKYLRPPYGDMDERTRMTYPYPTILWSVDTNDWQHPGTDVVVQRALDGAEPDGIILMHDIHPDTVAGAGAIVDGLLMRGYTLVTIDQLFTGNPPPQGQYFWDAQMVRDARHADEAQ